MEHDNLKRRERHVEPEATDMELVFVIWLDAHADRSGAWLDLDEIEDKPYVVHSAGFLLQGVKKDHISIAQSLGAEDGVVDHVLHIPNAMVTSIGAIGLPKIKRGLVREIKQQAKKDRLTK